MGITFTDNADLIKQLREASPADMNRATPGMVDYVCLSTLFFSFFIQFN